MSSECCVWLLRVKDDQLLQAAVESRADCFILPLTGAVEIARDASLRGKPIAVVQYDPRGPLNDVLPGEDRRRTDGRHHLAITVSYEAREKGKRCWYYISERKLVLFHFLFPFCCCKTITANHHRFFCFSLTGVTKNMRGIDALRLCPEFIMIQVPVSHGKADYSIYRDESSAVLRVLSETEYGKVVVQRASVNEAYLDLSRPATAMLLSMGKKENLPDRLSLWDSENFAHLLKSQAWRQVVSSCKVCTHVAGFSGDGISTITRTNEGIVSAAADDYHFKSSFKTVTAAAVQNGEMLSKWWNREVCEWTLDGMLLVCASSIMSGIRRRVEDHWGYTVSAGISETKILAKLACGMHKPNHQTIVPSRCSDCLLENFPIDRIIGLGGKLGDQVKSKLGLKFCGEVQKLALHQLWDKFGVHAGNAVYQLVRGKDTTSNHVVNQQIHAKTISCGKSFPGKSSLQTMGDLEHWVQKLELELQERLENSLKTNRKVASKLCVSFKDDIMNRSVSLSVNTCSGVSMVEAIIKAMVQVFKENKPPLEPESVGAAMEGNNNCCIFAITSLFLCAGAFVDAATPQITSFFHGVQQRGGPGTSQHGSGEKVNEVVVGSENCVVEPKYLEGSPVRTHHSGGHTAASQGEEGSTTTTTSTTLLAASEFSEKDSQMIHTSSAAAVASGGGVLNPYSKLKEAKELQDQLGSRAMTLTSTTIVQPKLQFVSTSGPPCQAAFGKTSTVVSSNSSEFEITSTITSPFHQSSPHPNPKQHQRRAKKTKPEILPLAGSKCEWAVDFDEVDPATLDELGDCWTSLIKTQIEEAKQQKVFLAEREHEEKKQQQRKARQGIGRFLKKM